MNKGMPRRLVLDDRECKVYDVVEKKLIGTYKNMRDCANALGIRTSRVQEIVRLKSRNRTNKLGKIITIR